MIYSPFFFFLGKEGEGGGCWGSPGYAPGNTTITIFKWEVIANNIETNRRSTLHTHTPKVVLGRGLIATIYMS